MNPAVRPVSDSTEIDVIEHRRPSLCREFLFRVPIAGKETVDAAVHTAKSVLSHWTAVSIERRLELLTAVADKIASQQERLAQQIAIETGKPIRDAFAEVDFAADLVRAVVELGPRSADEECRGKGWHCLRRPLGVVAAITPWNNPLAIPLGKLAPALLYGNAVVWKPSPAGTGIANSLLELLHDAELPPGMVSLVTGDRSTAELVASNSAVDAVSLTSSCEAGRAIQAICARRGVSFQGELGGNNAAIVCPDADLPNAAQLIAKAAFGSAGQRCTANRRVIVLAERYEEFLVRLQTATANLHWGDPMDEETEVGPLISVEAVRRIEDSVDRARRRGLAVVRPHGEVEPKSELASGAYYPPTLICCDNPGDEIVQEESFGPIVVVQKADGFDRALELCNGVRQGLVAALFSASPQRQRQFLNQAQAGMLKINRATAGAAADAPFGGWKQSGVGPFEHGPADLEFYTRLQTIYSE